MKTQQQIGALPEYMGRAWARKCGKGGATSHSWHVLLKVCTRYGDYPTAWVCVNCGKTSIKDPGSWTDDPLGLSYGYLAVSPLEGVPLYDRLVPVGGSRWVREYPEAWRERSRRLEEEAAAEDAAIREAERYHEKADQESADAWAEVH